MQLIGFSRDTYDGSEYSLHERKLHQTPDVWRLDFDAVTATGYDSDGKPDKLAKPTELAASTLNTTAKDYALFVEAIPNPDDKYRT
jgi:hypothetical protein